VSGGGGERGGEVGWEIEGVEGRREEGGWQEVGGGVGVERKDKCIK